MRALRKTVLGVLFLAAWTSTGHAGGLPVPGQATPLLTPYGSGLGVASGDFVSATLANGGLNSSYHYYIEVPPSLPRLVVELFDPDIGLGANGDLQTGGAFNTAATYTLRDPSGTTQATQTGNNAAPVGSNNAWFTLYDSLQPGPSYRAQRAAGGTAANVTITVPAGTATGDLLVAAIAKADGSTAITPPNTAVWTTVSEGACDNTQTAATCRLGVFYHVVQAGDPGTYTFTWPASVRFYYDMLRYSGADAAAPFDASAVQVGPPDTSPATAPTVTTSVSNALVMRIALADTAANFTGTPASNRTNQNSGGAANGVTLAVSDAIQATAGATGTANFTMGGTPRTWRTVTVAFKPPTVTPAAGHWELEVNSNSTVTAGDDNDGFGITAHDGDDSAGGTELNVYVDSEAMIGLNTGGSSLSYTFYPYVTSGCSMTENDFDFDSDTTTGTPQSMTFTSRLGFSQTIANNALSVGTAWAANRVPTAGTTWTTASDSAALDYGIWTQQIAMRSSGASAGNFGVVYTGDFAYAGTPPSASPEANTFRMYLPTDGNAAPTKPYLEQLLRWVSGPNPLAFPVVGGATTYAVTVRLVNPTIYPITFSTPNNLVTANVPAANVTYQGNVQVSQGSVTSQPAVGGTGNVVWNPGTVAGGATVLLAYRVAVTPTAAGQRIPATGLVSTGTGANGTRAQFVDETGNTTQGRATMLLGPICELASTVSSLTPAVVSSVRAHEAPGGVVVEWDTVSEVGTVGFDLLRWDPARDEYVILNKRLLPGLQGSPQGGRYRLVDEEASPRETYWYVVSEATTSGERRFHGPFSVQAQPETAELSQASLSGDYDRTPRKPPASLVRALSARQASVISRRSPGPRGATAMEVGVEKTGLYFVSNRSIASTLGLPLLQVQALARASRLSISNQGRPVAWTPVPAGVLFYGQAINSIYTKDNVYWLRVGPGLTMGTTSGGNPGPVGAGSFADDAHAEENHLAATVLSTDPDSDYWYWDFLSGGDPTYGDKSFPITAVTPDSAGGPGRLRVHLLSGTTTGVAGEHHAVVSLNGSPVGEVQWQGLAPATLDVPVSPSLIQGGSNTVRIQALLDPGVPYSFFFVDRFDLSYDRFYEADGNALSFRGDGHRVVTVDGFTSAAVAVFDVTDPARPRRVSRTTIDGSAGASRVSLVPAGPDTAYLASTPAAWRAPKWIKASASAGLKASGGADYVILTTTDLLAPARRLASLRQRRGLRSIVVDVADVMDEFSYGISDPRAIRAFLQWASARWRPAPRLVLLAGAGTFDYKDYLGYGGNLVPPLMVSTPSGLFASDNSLADLDGDGVPDVGVGRVPVLSSTEFDAYVQKLESYEESDGSGWNDRALWVADRASAGGDFPGQAESLVPQLPPGYTTDRIYLADGTLGTTRAQLFAGLNAGASVMNYVGHGGLDRLSSDGILVSSDAAGLTNGSRLPLLTALTCVINRFEVPGFSPLGAELLKGPRGGFSAVWAPTGLSIDVDARTLGERFFARLAAKPSTPVGELILGAVRSYAAPGRDPSLVRVYNLLGDPAVVLKTPPTATAPPPPPGGGTITTRQAPGGRRTVPLT